MPRKRRELTDAGVYHIVARGNNRQKLFRQPKDYQYYLDYMVVLRGDYRFEIYHYCMMANHVHFLIRFMDQESLQKVMQRINLKYAKRYRRKYKYCGHVFQDRFKSFAIEKDEYLLECGRYIERNPLKARVVKDPVEYRWSSYSYYAEGHPNIIVKRNPLYTGLGNTEADRREKYRHYVLTGRPYEKFIDEVMLR